MKVYIACPYTKGDIAQNVHNAIKVADMIAEMGHIPYVPVLAHFWHLVSPHPWEFWMKIDEEFLKVCDCVFRMDGESTGADREVELARLSSKPIFYNLGDLEDIDKFIPKVRAKFSISGEL